MGHPGCAPRLPLRVGGRMGARHPCALSADGALAALRAEAPGAALADVRPHAREAERMAARELHHHVRHLRADEARALWQVVTRPCERTLASERSQAVLLGGVGGAGGPPVVCLRPSATNRRRWLVR